MLDEAADISDEQGAVLRKGDCCGYALFETRAASNVARAGKSSFLGSRGIRPRLSAAGGMVIWLWTI